MEARNERPSPRKYELWRKGLSDRSAWLSASAIRDAFGGRWRAVLEALGLEPGVAVGSKRLRALGEKFERKELLDCLRACKAALGTNEFSIANYWEWARAERDKDKRAVPRVATSQSTFARCFGSWAKAMEAAGMVTRNSVSAGLCRAGAADTYKKGAMLEALKQVSEELKEVPTMGSYNKHRGQLVQRAAENGRCLLLPSACAIRRRFGTWAQALKQAGLISEDEARRQTHRRKDPVDEGEALAALREAMNLHGPSLTHAQYRAWRKEQLEKTDSRDRRLPAHSYYVSHMGGWLRAKNRAIAKAPDAPQSSTPNQGPTPKAVDHV